MPLVLNSSTLVQKAAEPRVLTCSASLSVDVIKASQIEGQLASHWETLRNTSHALSTPFFCSRYAKVVGELRPEARVAVVHQGGEVVAYLPFEQVDKSMIEPIGKAFNDAHGFICRPDLSIQYCDVLKALKLKAYRFHALTGIVADTSPYNFGTSPSFLANVEAHPEGYVPFLESTRETIFKQRRKTKKMIKDLGPLRLEIDCRNRDVLKSLIDLKRDQYQRTYIFDILGVSWAQAMLYRLWEEPSQPCRGLLSALYAGDTLVALHYGLLENGLLHYWFPTYFRQYHQYSPGTAIFLEIARQAPAFGIRKIDLGYGEQPYKHKFADTITHMPHGCVSCCPIRYMREKVRLAVTKQIKRVPGKPLLKKIVRNVWPNLGSGAFQ